MAIFEPFRTLGDIPDIAYLIVKCFDCNHSQTLSHRPLVAKLGRGFRVVKLPACFQCTACGRRSSEIDVAIPVCRQAPRAPETPKWIRHLKQHD